MLALFFSYGLCTFANSLVFRFDLNTFDKKELKKEPYCVLISTSIEYGVYMSLSI